MESEWEQFKAALREAGRVVEGADGGITVTVDLTDSRSHDVDAALGHAAGRDWIVLSAAVAVASELDPWEALAHNSTLAVGSLCAAEGMILLKHVTPVNANLGADALHIVADEAARLRGLVTARTTRRKVQLFANYGE